MTSSSNRVIETPLSPWALNGGATACLLQIGTPCLGSSGHVVPGRPSFVSLGVGPSSSKRAGVTGGDQAKGNAGACKLCVATGTALRISRTAFSMRQRVFTLGITQGAKEKARNISLPVKCPTLGAEDRALDFWLSFSTPAALWCSISQRHQCPLSFPLVGLQATQD